MLDDKWVNWMIAALIGGTAGTGIQLVGPDKRPDPFTGQMAERLADVLNDKILSMSIRIDRLEKRLDGAMEKLATLPPREVLSTISDIKSEIAVLKSEQRNLESIFKAAMERAKSRGN